ncbi:non-ribosomal peptide synthetase [Janthinobacterium sp. NFX145]|uniref:Non-ribosomal peptide synthetase n=2 Tax=Janthinobacterium TaxID=29580 RepID=A0ABY8I0Y9_9BURK|nr:non-ribosomal peptide synthetase [Janthinobacterium rivuli]WFR78174.1 non-ribosomal peptide synthetase [Janthinobacterium rivuli]
MTTPYTPEYPHQLVERQARLTPALPALCSAAGSVSYGELNARANRLARLLQTVHQVRPMDSVAVCSAHEPSRSLLLLALAKCGAVYVPVDIECPTERLQRIAQQAGVRLLLTALSERRMAAETTLNVLPCAQAELAARDLSDADMAPLVPVTAPLYIIFTSGSTGQPKGVAVSHAAAYNHFSWIVRYLNVTAGDCWLQSIHPCFDPSMHELMAPLMVGARIAFLGGERNIDGDRIVDAIERHQATHMTTVPTMLTLILQTPGVERCTSMRAMCVGGEVFRPALAARASALLPAAGIYNVYGPTEATIMASAWRYDGQPADSLPIGEPVPHTRFYLRDGEGRVHRLSPFLEGELCISGAALANGYVNDAAETARKFIANPLPEPEAPLLYQRLYLTGDVCRVDADGELHCIGRVDDQVKVNGQRVELAEIEATLLDSGLLDDVTALLAGTRLVAALVPGAGADDDARWLERLAAHAARALPPAWLPRQYLPLREIPRQALSGKADRKALQAMFASDNVAAPLPHAARDTAQAGACIERLAAALADTLGMPGAALEHDLPFAELGLDSLGVQVYALRVSTDFGVRLRAEELFEFFTLELLAQAIAARQDSSAASLAHAGA